MNESNAMGEHLVLYVDPLPQPPIPIVAGLTSMDSSIAGPSNLAVLDRLNEQENEMLGEDEPLIRTVECRICQEEDLAQNFEAPCACCGSLKAMKQCVYEEHIRDIRFSGQVDWESYYAHRKCVQRWCNEKGDITCEICHQVYQPGYTSPPPPPHLEDTAIDIRGWTITGSPLDLHDPRLLAIAEAESQFLEAEYDEYAATSASGTAFCRSAALILMALLLIRHALAVSDGDREDDTSAFFSLFLLRAAGFLLPCYVMAWAISILQQRRQRREAAALAATQVAFVLQSGESRGLHFTIAPHPPPSTTPLQSAS
ncbi:hypothetical protein V2J09_003768 [Rumex salicifolius]